MEIEPAPFPLTLVIRDGSQVGEARRAAMALGRSRGMSETECANVGIVATELVNNLVRHATEGSLVIHWLQTAAGGALEMVSIDRGPGMQNVGQCLQDGYSTGGTPGTGLGAVKRLSDEFDVYSIRGQGTGIVSRVLSGTRLRPTGRHLHWSAICRPAPHEVECGDIWRVDEFNGVGRLMVADGLGHGFLAALAAKAAAGVFDSHRDYDPVRFLETGHREIAGTRGSVAAAASVDLATGELRFAGIGNISATLFGPDGGKGLFSHNGTLGVQVRKFQQFDYTWPVDGMLIMHSDGIQTRWTFDPYPGLQSCHPAIIAAVIARDFERGRDDLTVLVAKIEAGT